MEIGAEISQKIRVAIQAKLRELDAYVDEELPDYIMVMVANKKTEEQMREDLELFLGASTRRFTEWLCGLLEKLKTITTGALKTSTVTTAETTATSAINPPTSAPEEAKKVKKKKVKDMSVDNKTDDSDKKKEKTKKRKPEDAKGEAVLPLQLNKKLSAKEGSIVEGKKSEVAKEFKKLTADKVVAKESIKASAKAIEKTEKKKSSKGKDKTEKKGSSDKSKVATDRGKEKQPKVKHRSNKSEPNPPEKSSQQVDSTAPPPAEKAKNRTSSESKKEEKTVPTESSSKSRKRLSSSGVPADSEPKARKRSSVEGGQAEVKKTKREVVMTLASPAAGAKEGNLVDSTDVLQIKAEDDEFALEAAKSSKAEEHSQTSHSLHKKEKESKEERSRRKEARNRDRASRTARVEPQEKSRRRSRSPVEHRRSHRSERRSREEVTVTRPRMMMASAVGRVVKAEESEEEEEEEYDPTRPALTRSVASVIHAPKRRELPRSMQANKSLLLKAISEAKTSVEVASKKVTGRATLVSRNVEPTDERDLRTNLHRSRNLQDRTPSGQRERPPLQHPTRVIQQQVEPQSDSTSSRSPSPEPHEQEDVKQEEYKPGKKSPAVVTKTAKERVSERPALPPRLSRQWGAKGGSQADNAGLARSLVKPLVHEPKVQEAEEEREEESGPSPKFVVTLDGLGEAKTMSPVHPPVSVLPPLSSTLAMNTSLDELAALTAAGKTERCRFWPTCAKAEQCPYLHPSQPCRNFPRCHFGDRCLYIHPTCKFDALCTRPNCPFSHTDPSVAAPAVAAPVRPKVASSVVKSGPPCRFYPNCTNPFCPYSHPAPKPFSQTPAPAAAKPCRYGSQCPYPGSCSFSHPPPSRRSGGDAPSKYKWSKTPAATAAKVGVAVGAGAAKTRLPSQ